MKFVMLLALAVQAPAPLAFDVASVKLIPGPVGFHNTTLQLSAHGFNANFAALRQIAGIAFNIQRVRIEGGPGWMDSDLYEIAAKAENPDTSANADQIREMLRTLLADRFHLAAHRETRQLPVYHLVLSKDGPKIEEVKNDPPGVPSTEPQTGQYGFELVFKNMPIVGLVNYLANVMGSPVLDQTGLKGRYNFTLGFARPGAARAGDSAPDIFEAVQVQLGLRLEGKKGPVEVVVVDHAEKASAN